MKLSLASLILLSGVAAVAADFKPLIDCYDALEGHTENVGIENTAVNLKGPGETRDLFFIFSAEEPPSVFVYSADDAWSFPLPPQGGSDVLLSDQRLANVKWADPKAPIFTSLLIETRRKKPTIIQIFRTDDDPRIKPHVFSPGSPPTRHRGDDRAAVQVFAGELMKKIRRVPGSFLQQRELFGLSPRPTRDQGKGAPPLDTEYRNVLDRCEQIVKRFPADALPADFKKTIDDARAVLVPKPPAKKPAEEGTRHRQSPEVADPSEPETHGGEGGPSEGPVTRPEADN